MSRLAWGFAALAVGLGLGFGLGASGAVDLLHDSVTVLPADQVGYYSCPDSAEIGRLSRGDRVLITGRSGDGTWVEVRNPVTASDRVWVEAVFAIPDGPIDGLPVRDCDLAASSAPPTTTSSTTTTVPFACAPEWLLDPADEQFAFAGVRITATGFTPGDSIGVRLDDGADFANVMADATGAFDRLINLPDIPAGQYTLIAEDEHDCLIGAPYVVNRTDDTTTSTTTTTVPADTTAPTVSAVTWTVPEVEELPESGAPVCPGAPQVIIQATVSDAGGVASVRVEYAVGTVGDTIAMTFAGGTWNAAIGPFAHTTIGGFGNSETISLTIRATDVAGNTRVFTPSGGPILNNCGTT